MDENFTPTLNKNASVSIASLALYVHVLVSSSILQSVIRVLCCARLIRHVNVTALQDMLN